MKERWDQIKERLAELKCLNEMKLRAGASSTAIRALQDHIDIELPESLKAFLSVHDGQDGFGLFRGYQLLSTDGIRREWDNWRSIDEEEMNRECADFMASAPEGFIKPMYTNRLWIPLTSDAGGNHFGLDYDPDHLGCVGQAIAFGRDEDTKRLLASDFAAFVEQCTAWLRAAKWNGEYLENAV